MHPAWPDSQKWKYTFIWLAIVGSLSLFGLLITIAGTLS
jgi:hypothetical protein